MATKILSRADIIQALGRWNRWGEARLDSGRPREVMTRLRSFLDTPEVVALIGPRRSGKTTILFQAMDALEAAGVAREAMLHINLEEPGFGTELGPELLERCYEIWRTEINPEGRAWLFLDEVQRVRGWERWVRARGETEDMKIFVANPEDGSRHNRGAAVDLTLFDRATGQPIRMTGGYDEFSERSLPDYMGGTSRQRWHRELLRQAMESEGFSVYEYEWWHFDYGGWERFPILNETFEALEVGG